MIISGRVATGLGQGVYFTRLDWARKQFMEGLGIDPYAGTVNLLLDSPEDLGRWNDLKSGPGFAVVPPGDEFCNARCYPVKINNRFPGAAVFPEVPGYPGNQVEIIAAIPLRSSLSLKDGDSLSLQVSAPISVSTVIFDADGTLVDSIGAFRVVADRVASRYGIAFQEDKIILALNNNDASFWELIVPDSYPDKAGFIVKLSNEAKTQWPEVLREFGSVFKGLGKTLSVISKAGKRMAIVTGSGGGSLKLLSDSGLMGYFEAVVTGRDVEARKPHPEGILKCLSLMNVNPEDAVYIGDTSADIRAARAAGTASIAVLTGAGNSEQLSLEGPDRIIYSHEILPEVLS